MSTYSCDSAGRWMKECLARSAFYTALEDSGCRVTPSQAKAGANAVAEIVDRTVIIPYGENYTTVLDVKISMVNRWMLISVTSNVPGNSWLSLLDHKFSMVTIGAKGGRKGDIQYY